MAAPSSLGNCRTAELLPPCLLHHARPHSFPLRGPFRYLRSGQVRQRLQTTHGLRIPQDPCLTAVANALLRSYPAAERGHRGCRLLYLVEPRAERALRRPASISLVRFTNHRLDEAQFFPDGLDASLETKNAGLKARPLQTRATCPSPYLMQLETSLVKRSPDDLVEAGLQPGSFSG